MALNLAKYTDGMADDIAAVLADLDPDATPATKARQIAVAIATQTDAYIRSATVGTTVSTAVTTVTVCPAGAGTGSGTGTGTGTGSLS